ncbi:AAA family ATPase [Solibacillus sp. FSL W7-1464]|uniref:AAA family ATPase n=1 Tax=Solibacillus sp. FSL W7-1464 TaxID=2921706 RepID=UPI0030FC3E94
MLFVQMSGFPGSGKSTLSRQIAKRTGAVIVDHDIVKSSLLTSFEEIPIEKKLAGKIAYNVDWSLVEFHLSQGQNVVLDSPCLYQEMVERGIGLSKKYNAAYKYVECYLNDYQEINNRLQSRNRMVSQIEKASSEEIFKFTIENSKKPDEGSYIIVNTKDPLESYIDRVIDFIME